MTTKKGGYPETIHQSLVALRGVLTNPEKNSTNPAFGSKYAKLEDIIHHVRGPLSENGLTFVQHIITEERTIKAQTILIHASGETMTLDGPAVLIEKFTAHGTGSAATYAKRYSLCTALGIESDADDDGNAVEETFKDTDTKKPPPKKTAAKKKATAKEEPPADAPPNTIANEEEAGNVLQFLCSTADTFAKATEDDLVEFWRANKQTIDLLDQGYPEHFKQLKAHFSALRASLKENHDV
jgi:hypothetical protein